MMLISGILFLVVSGILLFQIKKTQDTEKDVSQAFQKFLWIYCGILFLMGVNHTANGVVAPWISRFFSALGPLIDLLHVTAGIVLSFYLSRRRHSKLIQEQAHEKLRKEIG